MNTKSDTKQKILEVASELFAKNGFEGTSIREISKDADVNIASVNYHFTNKHNLYCEVMHNNIQRIEEQIQNLAGESENITEFAWKLFELLMKQQDAFVNSFKLFIANDAPLQDSDIPFVCPNNFQPPGFEAMMSKVSSELNDESIPQKGKEWVVRSIFSYVVHSVLVMSSTVVKSMEVQVDFLRPEEKKLSITCLAESVLNFLRDHPERFS